MEASVPYPACAQAPVGGRGGGGTGEPDRTEESQAPILGGLKVLQHRTTSNKASLSLGHMTCQLYSQTTTLEIK